MKYVLNNDEARNKNWIFAIKFRDCICVERRWRDCTARAEVVHLNPSRCEAFATGSFLTRWLGIVSLGFGLEPDIRVPTKKQRIWDKSNLTNKDINVKKARKYATSNNKIVKNYTKILYNFQWFPAITIKIAKSAANSIKMTNHRHILSRKALFFISCIVDFADLVISVIEVSCSVMS